RDLDDRSIRGQEELDGIILELLGVLLPTGGHDCECSLEPVSLNHTAAQSRVPTARVVPDQPPEYLTTTLELTHPSFRSLQRLPLQRRADRLRQRNISTRPDPAHRLDHPEPTTHRLKRRGRILTTMVAVKNRTFQCFSVVYCIL